MACYAIGDLQGCLDEFKQLLELIAFNPDKDELLLSGDLVNRGPKSLECLRFVKNLANTRTVLGNHDLHLLALAHGVRKPHRSDTVADILQADDRDELLTWLRQQPLMIKHESGFNLIHAGLPPEWDIDEAYKLANETSLLIASDEFYEFLGHMYGNKPDKWNDALALEDRHRFVINCLTRLRYCRHSGQLDFDEKGAPGHHSGKLVPWYAHPDRKSSGARVLFGHWSTVHLGTEHNFADYNVFPLDTGCLWGGHLSALQLDDLSWHQVPSQQKKIKSKM